LTWDTLPQTADGPVFASKIHKGELYLGGSFKRIGTTLANYVAKYSNGVIYPFDLPSSSYAVTAIEFYNDSMFIAGNFYDSLTNTNDFEVYDGTQWQRVGGFSFPFGNSAINALQSYNDELYIGGNFGTIHGFHLIKWNGFSYSGAGINANGPIWNMRIYNDELYICGGFTEIGGIAASGLAKWDGSQWSSVVPFFYNTLIEDFLFTPDGLYLVGGFTGVGGLTANYIVNYTGPVSVSEKVKEKDLILFPNPAKNQITIKFGDVRMNELKLLVTNIIGDNIDYFVIAPNVNSIELDLNDYSPGVYFVELNFGLYKVNKKFIKISL